MTRAHPSNHQSLPQDPIICLRECLRTWSPSIRKCNFIQFLLNVFQFFNVLSPHKVLCKSLISTSFKVEAPKTIEISSLEEIPLSSTLHYILAKCKRIQKLLQVEWYFLEFLELISHTTCSIFGCHKVKFIVSFSYYN